MKSPFKFLDAYTREDREIFFGRDIEIEELYRRAFEGKIMLVYGESGTGKSSLVLCGLANKFRDTDWLPLMVRRGGNIMDSIGAAVKAAAITSQQYELFTTILFKKAIRSLYIDYYKPIFFIFDQFEELFIFGSKEEKHAFVQLIQALSESDIECRFIFIIREEYMANVSEFEKQIRGFLSNRMRIEKMPLGNAVQAIKGPCSVFDIEVEEGFPEKLLSKLSPDSPDIELTYLQVFIDKIYNLASKKQEEEKGPTRFSSDLLEKTGDVSDLLGSFLDEQISRMPDQDSALAVLKSFVSVKGTKRQLNAQEVKDNAYTLGKTIEEPVLLEMIQTFVHLRILRDKDTSGKYELRHDALAKKIFEKISHIEKEILEIRQFIENGYYNWQKRDVLLSEADLKYIGPYRSRLYLSEELTSLIEKSEKALEGFRRRRRQLAFAIPTIVIIVLSAFTIWALSERKKSDINFVKAKASNYGMIAKEISQTDPTKALRLAEYSLSLDSSDDVRKTIYQIYRENSFYKIIAKLLAGIRPVCLLPDGKHLLTGSDDGIARLMDLNGKIELEFIKHTKAIYSVAFSPDGNFILTGSEDNTAVLWNINGDPIHIIRGHKSRIRSVTFSPDGKKILTGSDDKTAKLWDIKGNMVQEFNTQSTSCYAAFAPDGKAILTTDGTNAAIRNLDGKVIKIFKANSGSIWNAKYSPDGKFILACSSDRTAILFDLGGKILATFKGHDIAVRDVAFSPDGKTIVTTSPDNTARIWNLQGDLIQVLKGHGSEVSSATFSADGKTIYTGSLDNTVRSWELHTNIEGLFNIPNELAIVEAVFSPDSKTILIAQSKGNAGLYDLQGNLVHDFRESKKDVRIRVLRVSPNGQRIITGSNNATGCLWDEKGNLITDFGWIDQTGFLSDSVSFSFNSIAKFLRFYDINGKLINESKIPESSVNIFFSPYSKNIFYPLNDNTFIKTDMKNNVLKVFKGHEGRIQRMAFSSDGKKILTGSDDFTAILWDIKGTTLTVFKEHSGKLTSVGFSPDAQRVITLDVKGIARLWDIRGNLLQIINGEAMVRSAFFSEDGKRILTVSSLGEVRMTEILDPLADFQKRDNYEKLSFLQRIELKIITFKDVINSNDAVKLVEAADWYYLNSSISNTGNKGEYLENAIQLYEKASSIRMTLPIFFGLHKAYSSKFALSETSMEDEKKMEVFYRFLDTLNNPSDLSKVAGFLYNSGLYALNRKIKIDNFSRIINLVNNISSASFNYKASSKNICDFLMTLHSAYFEKSALVETSEEDKENIDKVIKGFDALTDTINIMNAGLYFYRRAQDTTVTDIRLRIEDYYTTIKLARKVENTVTYGNSTRWGTFGCYDSLSAIFFRRGDYKASIGNAVKAVEYEKPSKRYDETLYVRMALAYIFNKQIEEAVPIYREHKDKPIGQVKFSDYILTHLMQKPGMTVEEYEKIKEKLEK